MQRCFAALALRRFCLAANLNNFNKLSYISKIWFNPLPKDSQWIRPCQMNFIENGKQKTRDIIKIFDSVLIMLYNVSNEKLIYVRQFRSAVYYGKITGDSLEIPQGDTDLCKFPPEIGVTIEPCAGIMDKEKSLEETAKEEVLEECGYDVPLDSLEFIYEYRSGVGASSCALSLFYCEVCDAQKVSKGGGVGDEVIQILELSVDEARALVKTGSKINCGPATLIGTLWFLANKACI